MPTETLINTSLKVSDGGADVRHVILIPPIGTHPELSISFQDECSSLENVLEIVQRVQQKNLQKLRRTQVQMVKQ